MEENPENTPEKIHPLYTGAGDSGTTKDLFLCRIPKSGFLTELFVKMDRLQADIDKAINIIRDLEERELLEFIQKKLWQTYPMIQDPENKLSHTVSPVTEEDLEKLQTYIKACEKFSSNSFVRFHNDKSIMLNDCRVSTRDAEISFHRFLESSENQNGEVSQVVSKFFNRLSSLFFAMALKMEFSVS